MSVTPGLVIGATGEQVLELHDTLSAIGLSIDPAEKGSRSFGRSTQAAVATLQRICRLTVTGILDEETCAVIAAADRRLSSVAADGDDWFVVSGHVTWPEGTPVASVLVRAVNQRLRDEQPLGPFAPEFAAESKTDDCGAYRIPYCRAQFDVLDDDGGPCPSGPDLVVRALDADGTVAAESATLFDAPGHATVDLTVAGAVAGQPTEFHRLSAAIAPLLAAPGPPDLSVLQPSDLAYLTGATGWDSAYVSDLISAVALWLDAASADVGSSAAEAPAPPAIPIAAFYGLLREGLPSDWPSLLWQQNGAISAALEAAAKDGIVAQEIGTDAGALAADLAAIAAQQALTQPGTTQPSLAAQVLTVANLSVQQQQTVMQAASAGPASPQQFWESLRAEFDAPTVSQLQLTVQLGLLTGNHVPLMQALLADATVTSPRDLVTRDAAAWQQLLATTADGNPIGVPPGIPGGTPAQQAANYAQALIDTLHAAFPTQTVSHLAATVPEIIPVSDVRDGVGQFFANSPDFDIRATRISSYLTANPGTALQGIPAAAQQAVVDQLKRMQRAFQISVSAETMTTLLLAGLDAAHLVANIPPRSFIDRYAAMLGGQDAARAVYDRAVFVNARSVGLITQVNDTVFGTWPAALAPAGSQTATQQVLASYPDYAELFGALDPCACEDCTSVLSPTAYFVDMLQFLSRSTANVVGNTPLDVLIGGGQPALWMGTASPAGGDQVTLTLTAGAVPRDGDTIVGGGIAQAATVTAAAGADTYEITASVAIPAGTSATFYGGPAGLWTATASVPTGNLSNVLLLTLTSGPGPGIGDFVIGSGLPGVTYVTAVAPGSGPYGYAIYLNTIVTRPGLFPVGGGPPGVWLGTATPSGTSHLSLTLTLETGAEPQAGDMLTGGGIAGQATIAALSRGAYTLTTSQAVPAGADVTLAGGAASVWEATGSPASGTDQVSLTVTTVTAPRSGDLIIGGGLPQPCTVTDVSGTGPYAVSTSAAIPAGTDITFAGASPLGGRRPDLAYLKLTCENAYTELPYIDLVNEVLETYIQYNGPSALAAHDTGQTTSAQLEASPQHTLTGSTGPYFTLAKAVFPFTLPYNQPIAAARAYLGSLGTSRYQVMSAFEQSSPTGQPMPGLATPGQAIPATDAESLGLDPDLYELLTGTDLEGNTVNPAFPVAALYGYPPSAAGWETATASVPVFLARTGIEITDLIALLGTGFVNPHYPAGPDRAFFTAIPFDYATLQALAQAGFTSTDPAVLAALADAGMTMADLAAWWGRHQDIGSILVISSPGGSCDVADGVLAHLADGSPPTDAEYTAMQAFIRLWRVIGWAIADLDRTLSTLGGAITPSFVHALAQVLRLQAALGNLAPQTLLALWGDLDPDGDDSLYGQLFLNPATLPLDPVFAPAPDGAVLQPPLQMISLHLPALAAALQVSVGDVNLISADASVTTLTLTDVSTLYRYAVIARALGMTVADFIALRSLAGAGGATDPFASPDAAVAFVALARAVQDSGFTVGQLGYLYRSDSAPPAGLAPQQTTLLVLAQGLRDGLTQIAAQCAVSDDPKGTRTAAALTQLFSKDVATKTVALVNGTAMFTAPLAALPAGITEITAATNPPGVGAKLSYDPGAGLLRNQGAMTTAEYGAVQAMSPGDAGWQTAVTALYTQPATFLTGNLGALLGDPNAVGTLLRATASLDGQLNPVLLDAGGNVVTDPAQAATTEIAVKFGYLLGRLLPYLQDQLSRTLVKQTVSDAFTLDPAVGSLLLEQLLTSPTSGGPLIGDLLGLITTGVTATCYPTPELSETSGTTSTVKSVDFDGTASAPPLPAGTQSAAFTSWVEVPASATFTFRVQTNGSPALFVGDQVTQVTLTPDASGVPTATVPLTAGQMCYLRLEVTALPAGTPPVVVLTWQSPTTPVTPVPTAVQLPDAVYRDFTLGYVRIQKAALLASQFGLTAAELAYLQSAGTGTSQLFGGFDLNALPVSAGLTAAQAAALFAAWPRLNAYTTLRNSLPGGSVTLTDVFTAGTFDAASALVPQATGWDPGVVGDLLAVFFPGDAGQSPPISNTQLVDEIALTNIAACVQLVRQTGASCQQLFGWARYYWPLTGNQTADQATFDGLDGVAGQIRKACAARHDPQAWLTLAGQLSDTLRSSQRDALVAYLLGANGWTDPGQLFDLLLIDPEMGTCMQTSRIRQALNSVQLFVQRCLLNLEASPADRAAVVEPGQIDAATWREWMSAYSLWAANREVFLYPENWLLPGLRDDQTELFEAFASALQQGPVSAGSLSASFLGYLKGLRQIERLDIRAMFWQAPSSGQPNPPAQLHVFGRTFHAPRQYYYRRQIDGQGWTPWQQVTADIQGDHLVAVIYEGRLRLMWPVFTEKTYTPPSTGGSGVNSVQTGSTSSQNYWQITLAWCEYYQGEWQPKNVTDEFLLSFITGTTVSNSAAAEAPKEGHLFKARIDGGDLVVDVYISFDEFDVNLLGEFRFTAHGQKVSVGYNAFMVHNFPPPAVVTPSPNQNPADIGTAKLVLPPSTGVYNNGFLLDSDVPDQQGMTLETGDFGDYPWSYNGTVLWTPSPYLAAAVPTRFELRCSQQYWQFAEQSPFFYQDADRTFCITPAVASIIQLADPSAADPAALFAALSPGVASANPAGTRYGTSLGNWITAPSPQSVPTLNFETHYHPYVSDLIEDLLTAQGQDQAGGVGGVLTIANQNPPPTYDFGVVYHPNSSFVQPPAPETIDFTAAGPYSAYNWELFFHGPLLTALTLSQNQQYADADAWFRFIFDPTNADPATPAPDRYWQVRPFRNGVPQTLIDLMNAIDAGDPDALSQLNAWYQHPFDPFLIARLRLGAFMKNVFMAYLDNLIAWGDQLFGQVDTIESINQATQLYLLAAELLGQLPQQIPAPQAAAELSYAQVRSKLDQFSNFAELVENEFPFAGAVSGGSQDQSAGLLGLSEQLFFCIPQNSKLLQYWTTVSDRLNKIRSCLNIAGVPQQLALFQPPANPLLLIEAAAAGIDPGSVLADLSAPLPNYRFSYLIGKAAELASACQGLGRQLLDALEKKDAEGLALLRATQESTLLTSMRDQKVQQLNEANASVQALNASRAVAVSRYQYYQILLGAGSPATPAPGVPIPLLAVPAQSSASSGGVQLIDQEQSELRLSQDAALLHALSGVLQTIASFAAVVPTESVFAAEAPFGVGLVESATFGGLNVAAAEEAVARGLETAANVLTYAAWAAGKMGGYSRRQQEWTLQSNVAAGEIMQIDQQIAAASLRVTIATDELSTHDQQTANALQVQGYLTGKFTSEQLYDWTITQTSALYSQLYQLAYGTAKRAETAFQRELGVADTSYITFGYWDSLRRGLLSGDRLQLAIRQLEQAFLDQNQRDFEITRHISLLLHDPAALIMLKTTGQCLVDLPEQLFDMDYPGHYQRMMRDVSLTIPCVAGPYTSINCTLTLVSSKIRTSPGTSGKYPEASGGSDPRFLYYLGSTSAIATSHGQDDSGVFSVNFRDERYLPFETAGAISRWVISMPPACNAFDFDTITDVVLKLSYTARYGGDALRAQAFAAAALPALPQQTQAPAFGTPPAQADRDRLFSLRHEFPTEWYGLLHPADTTAAYGQMPMRLTSDRFPFQYRGRKVTTAEIEVIVLLRSGATLSSLDAYLTPAGPPPPYGNPLPVPPTELGNQIALGGQSIYGANVLYGKSQATPVQVPQLWWLSIPAASLSEVLAQVEDVYVLFHYSVA